MRPTVQTRKLRCTVRPGMFTNEAAIVVVDAGGVEHSFFVPREKVPSGHHVTVRIRKDASGAYATIPTGELSSVVLVRPQDLE